MYSNTGKNMVQVMAKGSWILLLISLLAGFLSAQNYPTRHFTMRDGLPGMTVRCIFKDTRGLLWIGTDSGLSSFDGRSFHIFKASEGMTASQVWAIAEDEDGNMWFGSHGEGLFKYNGKKFERFTRKNGLVDDRIRVLLYSKNFHCLIAGSYRGVSTIRNNVISTSTGYTFSEKNGGTVTGLADAGKFIYITTYGANNPLRYYPDKNLFISIKDPKENPQPVSFSVFIDSRGDTIFSYNHYGVRIYKREGMVQNESMGQIFGISEDKRGDLWFASWSYPNRDMKEGIFKYDGKTFRNYNAAFGITDKEIWTVFCDKEQDILWIGTLNEGLFMVPFTHVENFPASYFNLQNHKINSVFRDSKNGIWISGNHELIRMSQDGSFSLIEKHPMIVSFKQFWDDRNMKDYYELEEILKRALTLGPAQLKDYEEQLLFDFKNVIEEPDHSVFFSNRFGLFEYDPDRKKSTYLGPDGNFGDFAIAGGDTLITTQWGPTKFIPNFKRNRSNVIESLFFYLTRESDNKKSGDPKDVNRLVKHGNQFWYASLFSGLWMSEGLHLVHFNESDSTISNNLNDICFDEKGHVIFGSNTGEICIATYANRKLNIDYKINNENGLQGRSISWMVPDQNGKLWIGTNLGLNILDLDELYTKGNYDLRFMDEEEGYTGQTSKRAVTDTSGNLWIGAEEQLIRINTRSLLSNQTKPGKVILKSMDVSNLPADSILKSDLDPWTSLPLGRARFSHSENDLVFYFDILSYSSPGKNRFRYMLRGYDKTWNKWSTGRKAVYTNLPPGEYTFCAESHNLSTGKYADPLMYEFSIRQAWWKLWYVKLLLVGLLLELALLFTRRYIKAERKKQNRKAEFEKKIVELEMQALQAQMNPHFIFNCISGIQFFILSNRTEEVLNYLADFSKVVRESLTNATLRSIPLKDEIEFLHCYLRLEQMRFPDRFEYQINYIDREDAGYVFLPPMLVQPFAENAISHGFSQLEIKGKLTIIFEIVGADLLKCTIHDNGKGRDKTDRNKRSDFESSRPHSTKITETRVRLFNQVDYPDKYQIVYTDMIENGNPCGLKVELYLPLQMG